MKKRTWLSASVLSSALLFLYGCRAVETAPYSVTSYAEIPIRSKAIVRVMADSENQAVAQAFSALLEKETNIKLAEQDADYWIVLRGAGAFREPVQASVTSRVEQDGETGGEEVLISKSVNVASAARELAIAIYDAKNLAPVHYATVALHDGDNSEEATRSREVYVAQFADEVLERVKDMFLTQEKEVNITIPLEASADLREAFKAGDYNRFLLTYKEKGTLNLAQYVESIRNESCEDDNIDERLANYHLYLLVKEAKQKDAKSLQSIKSEQLMLLQASKAEGLVATVPVALARIEHQLKYAD